MANIEENTNQTIRCSFCGRGEEDVEFLIPSPILGGAYICNDCIDACARIIDDHKMYTEKGDSLSLKTLPKPQQIKKTLDEYVIGQEEAKKVLSVSVYNHYKRILSKESSNAKNDVEIQNYMYNFPSYEYARSVPNSNLKSYYYTVRYPMMHKLMRENNTLVAHTGFSYQFADCNIEILFTHEDFYPEAISDFNNSSTVFKITLAGKSFLVAGDLEEPGQKACNKQAGNLLNADFLQITHHGHNGQIEFYQYIVGLDQNGNFNTDTTTVLWTLPRKENPSQYSKPANKWIKENIKQIHFGFENRVYDLS